LLRTHYKAFSEEKKGCKLHIECKMALGSEIYDEARRTKCNFKKYSTNLDTPKSEVYAGV